MPTHPIPAFVNPASGSGEAARDALEGVGGFEVVACDPEHLDRQIERAVSEGAERIVVAAVTGPSRKPPRRSSERRPRSPSYPAVRSITSPRTTASRTIP